MTQVNVQSPPPRCHNVDRLVMRAFLMAVNTVGFDQILCFFAVKLTTKKKKLESVGGGDRVGGRRWSDAVISVSATSSAGVADCTRANRVCLIAAFRRSAIERWVCYQQRSVCGSRAEVASASED